MLCLWGDFVFALLQYTTAMMGYGPEDKNVVLELTYNYGVKEYDKGNGYAQVICFTFSHTIFTFEFEQHVQISLQPFIGYGGIPFDALLGLIYFMISSVSQIFNLF